MTCCSTQGSWHVPGQKRVVVLDGVRERDAPEQPVQVTVGIDSTGFAGFDERVKIGARSRAVDSVREQPAAAPDHKRADRILTMNDVVRYGPVAVLNIEDQLRPLRAQVG